MSNHKIKKNETFKNQMYENFHVRKLEVYEKKIRNYHPSQIENNIIIGSLFDDASIACYGEVKHLIIGNTALKNKVTIENGSLKCLSL